VYDDRAVIVMELIEGETLRGVLARGALTPVQTYALMDQLLDAVAYAHERDVTHRDLKPDNVFVTPDGAVKLADFGIAQVGQEGPPLTCPGTMLGTPAYMAPEQIRGEEVDVRCDVFALGVIAFECLAGESPFGSGTSTHYATIVHRIINEPVPQMRTADAAAGPLAGVIKAALAKDRARRFRSAAAMRAAWRASFTPPEDARASLGSALASAHSPRATSVPRMPESTLVWGASLRRKQGASQPPQPEARRRDQGSQVVPGPGNAASVADPDQCPTCGEKLAEGVRFCRNCGRLVRRSRRGRS
jgi:serine/threonine-protein kinase